MPLQKCTKDGKTGWRYGATGACYTFTPGDAASEKRAKKRAVKQAVAIGGGTAPADLSDRDLADAGIVRTRELTKWCRACEKIRPEARFRADGRTSDGLATICETCRERETNGMSERETVDIEAVELLAAGGPYFGSGSPPEGDFFTTDDLDELAASYAALHDEVRIPVKIGHNRAQTLLANSGLSADEQPAAGWVENVRRDGEKLLGDLRSVPKKLAELMKLDAFRTRSVELSKVKSQTLAGREFPNVLTGLALLGAKAPAVRTLDDILAWYAEAHDGVELVSAGRLLAADADDPTVERTVDYAAGDVLWSAEDGCNDWMDDLAEALNGDQGDSYGPDGMWIPPRYSILDLDQRAGRALVADRQTDDDYVWVVPFAVDAQGDPEPASDDEWTLASRAWIEVGEPVDATALSETLSRFAASGRELRDADVRDALRSLDGFREGADTTTMPTPLQNLNDETIAAFAETLGIEETDPTARREAVAERIGETTTPPDPTPPPTPGPPPAPDPGTPTGEEQQLPASVLSELAESRSFRERSRIASREANLRVALSQGRIDPSALEGWRAFFDADEELAMTQLLSQPANLSRIAVFGQDGGGTSEQFAQAADDAYAAYAAATGVRPASIPNGGQS